MKVSESAFLNLNIQKNTKLWKCVMEMFQIMIDSYQCNSSMKKRVMSSALPCWFPGLMGIPWFLLIRRHFRFSQWWPSMEQRKGRSRKTFSPSWPVVKEEFLLFQNQGVVLPWWPHCGISSLCSLHPRGSLPSMFLFPGLYLSLACQERGHFWEGKGTFPGLKKSRLDCVWNHCISLSFSYNKSTQCACHDRC